jgi:signal transduction histidine kinase
VVKRTGAGVLAGHGIGLGLSLSKQIVEKMGGEIEIFSDIDIGTRVSFKVPIKCKWCQAKTMDET